MRIDNLVMIINMISITLIGLRTDENNEENGDGERIAEDENDQIKIVDWETEWWQKIGAKINH